MTGKIGDGESINPQISSDGRYVAFQSAASNFVSNDLNGAYDIFVDDLKNNTLTLVSSNKTGGQGNHDSFTPNLSADGSTVAFASDADNLVSGDSNINRDVFVKNISTGAIQLVSVNPKGVSANGLSDSPSLSADGTKIAFRSFANDLVVSSVSDKNSDIYVKDLTTNNLTQVNLTSDGNVADGQSWNPQISPDGNYVAFLSDASNLVTNDKNGVDDVFIKNLQTGELTQISDGDNGDATSFVFSGDSSTLAFSRWATDSNTENVYSFPIQNSSETTVDGGQRDYTLSVDNSDVDEDGTTAVTFTVTISEPSDTDITIPFALSGTASRNTDYQGSLTKTSAFTIPAGETSTDLSFVAKVDTLAEKDETVVLTLNPTDDSTIIDNGRTVTIHNVVPPFQGKKTADQWTGTKDDDTAFGNGGNDTLSGVAGDDSIDGGDGNDKITGGKGIDELTGGNGIDTFVFNKGDSGKDADTADTITDLSKGDKIDLSNVSKTFNLIKTVASDVNGTNLKLSSTKFDAYVANLDGNNYLVYETTAKGTTHEIIAIGSDVTDVSTWTIKAGIFTV